VKEIYIKVHEAFVYAEIVINNQTIIVKNSQKKEMTTSETVSSQVSG